MNLPCATPRRVVRTNIAALLIVFTTFAYFWAVALSDSVVVQTMALSLFGGRLANEQLHSVQNLSHLAKYELAPVFTYSMRKVHISYDNGVRRDITNINRTLFSRSQRLSKVELDRILLTSEDGPISLRVPRTSSNSDGSILAFGMATTIERLNASISPLKHWLANSGANLHAIVPTNKNIPVVLQNMTDLGIKVTIETSDQPFVTRYFSLTKSLYERRTKTTRWLVIIDDDTFFPSLPSLLDRLATKYDYKKPQLIGGTSEDQQQVNSWGEIPFGGAGIFLSLPLARQIVADPVFSKCLASERIQGDQILADCIKANTAVKAVLDSELHQIDLRGDVSGFFESGRKVLSLHHWKSWHHLDVAAVARVSQVCGHECILQRWIFPGSIESERLVLSNGYSIARYPYGIEFDLREMEQTWLGDDRGAFGTLAPMRDRVELDMEKIQLLMIATEETAEGIRQTYAHKTEKGLIDEVMELTWLFDKRN